MARITAFAYGVICYVIFFVTFLYLIGFIGNIAVPRGIDSPPLVPLAQALLVNLGLILLFALQHSVMARPTFKRWWNRFVPKSVERSTYVLLSSVALAALMYFWQPVGGTVWHVDNTILRGVIFSIFGAGVVIVLISTFLINHFDLFGLRQVYLRLKNREYTQLPFGTPGLYKIVRHPLYVGWLLTFWATPTMTVTHLVLAIGWTAYILIAIQLEERNLMAAHPEYHEYRKRVPMLIPGPANKTATRSGAVATSS